MKGALQSILIPKKWKREAVEKWLARHQFKAELEEEGDNWVAEQEPADSFARIRSVRKARGIVFKIGYKAEVDQPAESRPWWDVPLGDLFNRTV